MELISTSESDTDDGNRARCVEMPGADARAGEDAMHIT
jgi:hypothetical protein